MKQFVITIMLGLLLLVSCGGGDIPLTEIPVAQLPTTTSTIIPPTIEPTTPLPTVTPEQTNTPTSTATPIPAIVPEPTKTAVLPNMLPEGYLLFFWDTKTPVEHPAYYSIPVSDPQQNLYIAVPDKSFEEWRLSPILSEQLNWPDEYTSWPTTSVSPDQTQLAFTLYKRIDADSYTVSIFIADFDEGTLTQITEDDNVEIYNISWLPDNQTIAYSLGRTGLLANTDNVTGTQFTPEFSSDVSKLTVSPDGQFVAMVLETNNSSTGKLFFYDLSSEEISPVSVNSQFNPSDMAWSSDSNWFTSNLVSSGGLMLFNAQTQEPMTLSDLNKFSLPSWSPTTPLLAFVAGDRADTDLYLWNSTSQDTEMIVNLGSYLGNPIWSPQGNTLAVAFAQDEMIDLLSVDIENGKTNIITHFSNVKQFEILSWSPNGEWILVFLAQEDKSCLYIVNHRSGETYCAVDSTGMTKPYAVHWLPNQSYLP